LSAVADWFRMRNMKDLKISLPEALAQRLLEVSHRFWQRLR